MTTQIKKKNGKVELQRFLFSVIVFVMHAHIFAPPGFKDTIFRRGMLGVEFFFFVSGYFMMRSVARKGEADGNVGPDTIRFLIGKIKALFPTFGVAWVIAFVVMAITKNAHGIKAIVKLLVHCVWELLFLTQAGFGTTRANGVDWYISAMLLGMLILYPLARKYQKTFSHVIAPAIGLFILGYMAWKTQTPTGVRDSMVIATKGMFRAIAELGLGAALYPMVNWLQGIHFTKFGKWMMSLFELIIWGGTFGYMIFVNKKTFDMVEVLLIWILILLALAHQGALADFFDNKLFVFLGKFSLSIYLSHIFWVRYIEARYFGADYFVLLKMYLPKVIVTSIVVYIVSELLRKYAAGVPGKIKALLIQTK